MTHGVSRVKLRNDARQVAPNHVKISWLLATFGEVESTGTSTRGMEELSLSNGAVFPTFLWTGKRFETSKLPRFTKSGQEPNGIKLVESHFLIDS
jgi:hypothetical protein